MKATSTISYNFRSLLVAMSISITAMAIGCGGGGSGGTAGSGGGGTGGTAACDIPKLFNTKYYCSTPACHAGATPAAGFDMMAAGWETHLVGKAPMTHTPASPAGDTLCAGMNKVYLTAGSNPATGLFMDKISKSNPGCGVQMPNLPVDKMTADELACVQTWANALTAAP